MKKYQEIKGLSKLLWPGVTDDMTQCIKALLETPAAHNTVPV